MEIIYLFIFWRGKEKTDKIHSKYKSLPPLPTFILLWERGGDLPLNSPIWTLRTETGLCLFFSSLENLYQAPNIYSLGARCFRRVSHHL